MTDFTVYTLGGGEALKLTFEMVAKVIGTDSYMSAIKISVGFGLMWALIDTAFKGAYLPTAKWIMTFVVLFNVLFVPKSNVVIVDRMEHGPAKAVVSGVPWGLAWFASITSEVGDLITRTMEQASSLPSDSQYHKTGVLFGSKLIEQASDVKIIDPDFAKGVESFIKQCVLYDIHLGKYSMNDLVNASDIWEFVGKYGLSEIRSFTMKGGIFTCKDGGAKLSNLWSAQIAKSASHYGVRFFRGLTQEDAKATFLSKLPGSYQYLLGVSKSAGEILRQNMMINAFHSAIKNNNAEVGATAAINNYVQTRAEIQATAAYKSAGKQAEKFVPLLRIVFECLYYGIFPLIFLAMMLPIGGAILKNYFLAFIWIQSWPALYAILNMLMTIDVKSDGMSAALNEGGSRAITLMTHNGIIDVNSDIGVIAGYLSLFVPFIAAGITKGAASFGHLATSMLSVAGHAGVQAAEEGTTGNIRIASSSQDVHSYNQTTANQHLTSSRVDGNSHTLVGGRGEETRMTADNSVVVNDTPAHSQLPTSAIQTMQSATKSMSTQADRAETLSQNQMTQSREAAYSAMSKANLFNSVLSQSESSNDMFRNAENTSIGDDVASLRAHNTASSKVTGAREADNAQMMTAISAGMPFKAFWKQVAGVGAEARFNGATMAETSEQYSRLEDYMEKHSVGITARNVMDSARDQSYSTGGSQQDSLNESVRSDWSKSQELSEMSSQNLTHAESLRNVEAIASQQGFAFSGNVQQEFIEAQHRDLGEMDTVDLLHNPARTQELQDRAVDFMMNKLGSESLSLGSSSDLQGRYESAQNEMKQANNTEMQYNQNSNEVREQGAGIQGPSTDYKVMAANQMAQTKSFINSWQDSVNRSGSGVIEEVQNKQNDLQGNTSTKVLSNTISNTVDAAQSTGSFIKSKLGFDNK